MKLKGTASLALLLTGALFLGACTSDTDPGNDGTQATGDVTTSEKPGDDASEKPSDDGTEGGEGGEGQPDACIKSAGITESADDEIRFHVGPGNWSGYNSSLASTYSTYNSVVANQMFSGFTYFGTDGTICKDESFGTFEVKSEDPLVIEYTISDDAKWSDGVPVTVNDYLFDWVAQNPEFLVPGLASGENQDATPVFNHVSTTLAKYVPEGPKGEVDGKTFTVEYNEPNPDYQIMIGGVLPAHIAAQQSGLEPAEFAQAILDQDAEKVKQVAEFFNEGWTFEPGQLPDMAIMPSNGPYKVKEGGWQAPDLTLEPNENYWGEPAGVKNLIMRYMDEAPSAQALQNGDVNVIQPQATVDTLPQLEAIGDAVKVEPFSTLTWEHLDFNFRETNVFSDEQGGLNLRQAFAYCVPRQDIVNNLVKPINPDTELMNAREVFPFQDDYQAVVGEAYGGEYDNVDLDKARELVEASGVSTPIDVRIGYLAGNTRRQDTVAAIKASCDQVGFNIKDSSSATFFTNEIVAGDYEVALFAWAGSGQIASGQNIYSSTGQQNYGQYSNDEVDAAWKTLAGSLDPAVHLEQTKVIETALWKDLFGIPLYAHPGVAAWDSTIQNVRPTSTQSQISWNAAQWTR